VSAANEISTTQSAKDRFRLPFMVRVPLPGPPATFGKLIADETEKWGKVVRFAGIKSQ
jgi:hypothetical protein